MTIEIEDQKVIGQIVGTFARKPKTHIEHIRIYESRKNEIARILYYDGRQRRHGEHECSVDVVLQEDAAYLRFYCCHTQKMTIIKLEVIL